MGLTALVVGVALAVAPGEGERPIFSAQCLREVGLMSGDFFDIRDEEMRTAARLKAEALWDVISRAKSARAALVDANEEELARIADEEAVGRMPPGSEALARRDFMAPIESVDRVIQDARYSAPSCQFPPAV